MCALRGERWSEVLKARLDGLRDGHDEAPVAVDEPASADDRERNDALGSRSEMQNVALRGLLPFRSLGLTDVQVENVAVLVPDAVEQHHAASVGIRRGGELRLGMRIHLT